MSQLVQYLFQRFSWSDLRFILFSISMLMLAGSRVGKQFVVNTMIDLTLMLLASPITWKFERADAILGSSVPQGTFEF